LETARPSRCFAGYSNIARGTDGIDGVWTSRKSTGEEAETQRGREGQRRNSRQRQPDGEEAGEAFAEKEQAEAVRQRKHKGQRRLVSREVGGTEEREPEMLAESREQAARQREESGEE